MSIDGSGGNYSLDVNIPDLFVLEQNGSEGTLSVTEYDQNPTAPVPVSVSDAPISITGNQNLSATVGVGWSDTVATITDSDTQETGRHLSVTVAWSDGQTDNGALVSSGNGVFTVTDSRTFYASGSMYATVTVSDSGGASNIATTYGSVIGNQITGISVSDATMNVGGTSNITVTISGSLVEAEGCSLNYDNTIISLAETSDTWDSSSETITYQALGLLPGTTAVTAQDAGSSGVSGSGTATVNSPVLTIATTANAQENGDQGNFQFTLQNPDGTPYANPTGMTIGYSTDGSAIAGVNYAALSGTVFIAVGQSVGDVVVNALEDNQIDPVLTVTLTASAGSQFASGGTLTADCSIYDGDTRSISVPNTFVAVGDSEPAQITVSGMFSQPDPVDVSTADPYVSISGVNILSWNATSEIVGCMITGVSAGIATILAVDAPGNNGAGNGNAVHPAITLSPDQLAICSAGSLTKKTIDATVMGPDPVTGALTKPLQNYLLATGLSVPVDGNPDGYIQASLGASTNQDGIAKITITAFRDPGEDSVLWVEASQDPSAPQPTCTITVQAPTLTVQSFVHLSSTIPQGGTGIPTKSLTVTATDPTNGDAPIVGLELFGNFGNPALATFQGLSHISTGADGAVFTVRAANADIEGDTTFWVDTGTGDYTNSNICDVAVRKDLSA